MLKDYIFWCLLTLLFVNKIVYSVTFICVLLLKNNDGSVIVIHIRMMMSTGYTSGDIIQLNVGGTRLEFIPFVAAGTFLRSRIFSGTEQNVRNGRTSGKDGTVISVELLQYNAYYIILYYYGFTAFAVNCC